MSMPSEGRTAPDFRLPADDGGEITLSALRPSPVVLYFYPRDDTPGCTTEAKDFTALAPDFAEAGARVLGVSKDSVGKHGKFRDKHDLSVTLLSDTDSDVAKRYGVWVEKKMYGRSSMGIQRATFLIDGTGVIRRVWPKVTVAGHAEAVIEAVRAL